MVAFCWKYCRTWVRSTHKKITEVVNCYVQQCHSGQECSWCHPNVLTTPYKTFGFVCSGLQVAWFNPWGSYHCKKQQNMSVSRREVLEFFNFCDSNVVGAKNLKEHTQDRNQSEFGQHLLHNAFITGRSNQTQESWGRKKKIFLAARMQRMHVGRPSFIIS